MPLYVLGQLCAEVESDKWAPALLEAFEPYAHLHTASVNLWLGPASHPRARLLALAGRRDEADKAFASAVAVYQERSCSALAVTERQRSTGARDVT